jgi:hypothetical protein
MCGEKGDRIQETVFRPDLPTDHPASLEAMRGTAQMDTDVRALTTKSSKADEMVRKEVSRKGAKGAKMETGVNYEKRERTRKG